MTTTQVTEAGIPRRCLSVMVESGAIYRVERGIHTLPEVWEDELFFIQYRFPKGIFSHETALYLHGMTDRTADIQVINQAMKAYAAQRIKILQNS